MTPVGSSDWDGLKKRVEAASRLTTRAFLEDDRAAWEVAQVVQFKLQHKGGLRPTDSGDVHVLNAMYAIEDQFLPSADIPKGLTPIEFCEMLKSELMHYSWVDTVTTRELLRKATHKDWDYLCYQHLVPSNDFTRFIAIASLALPHRFSMVLFSNLYDEGGHGVWEKTHYYLLNKVFMPQFGFDDENEDPQVIEDTSFYWTPPEYLAAMFNIQSRLLWHPEPGWSLGSLYLGELLVPGLMEEIRDSLLAAGFDKSTVAFQEEHIVVDVKHAEDWIGVVEEFITAYQDQQIVYKAAVEAARWGYWGWNAYYHCWRRWKETGTPPHLPARELHEATGL